LIDWTTLLFSPRGRIGRRAFWIGFVIWAIASWLAWLLPGFTGPIAAYMLLWVWISISVKRLHDMGRSGWLVIAPFIIGMIGFVISALLLFGGLVAGIGAFNYPALGAAALSSLGGAAALAAVANMTWLCFLGWIGFSHGRGEVNIYGPPPGMAEIL
jgi:uncharacterized membrane protein YhaH (DUF805 family)